MNEPEKKHGMERAISRTLRAGVLTSAAVTLTGLLLFLITGQSGYPGGSFPTTPLPILAGVLALKPYAVILLGLFILILTPVLRVGLSIFLFLHEKDVTFARITALVFTILIVSFLLGTVE